MGRLIDADALIKRFEVLRDNHETHSISYNALYEVLVQQPTAYDVGKVVAELACNSRFIDDINEHNIKCISCVIGQKTAIDIVRKGGASHRAYSKSIEIVNELAEEYKEINIPTIDAGELLGNGWIPCSERLPEVNTRVMCFTTNKTYVFAEYGGSDSHYLDNKDVWFSDRGWYRRDSIIAWQPLPAPYMEKVSK